MLKKCLFLSLHDNAPVALMHARARVCIRAEEPPVGRNSLLSKVPSVDSPNEFIRYDRLREAAGITFTDFSPPPG